MSGTVYDDRSQIRANLDASSLNDGLSSGLYTKIDIINELEIQTVCYIVYNALIISQAPRLNEVQTFIIIIIFIRTIKYNHHTHYVLQKQAVQFKL